MALRFLLGLGAALIVIGCGLIALPIAFIAAGVFLLATCALFYVEVPGPKVDL